MAPKEVEWEGPATSWVGKSGGRRRYHRGGGLDSVRGKPNGLRGARVREQGISIRTGSGP